MTKSRTSSQTLVPSVNACRLFREEEGSQKNLEKSELTVSLKNCGRQVSLKTVLKK